MSPQRGSGRHLPAARRGIRVADEERILWIGMAVTLLALAGVCALLSGHFVLGILRLAASVLAGAGVAAVLLAVLGERFDPRGRTVAAGAPALAVMLALTVPAVLEARLDRLGDLAAVRIEALAEGDVAHSLPTPGSPILVRRADGRAQLLDRGGVRTVEASDHDVVALSTDGSRLLRSTGVSTEVLAVDRALAAPDGTPPSVILEGTPLALTGDVLVMRDCPDGTCRLAGIDLTAPEEPLWVVSDAAETHGPDPAGRAVPALPEEQPGLLDAMRATGVVPEVPLRFDPAQGWVQLDPATGFPVGRILAPAEEDCRIAATAPQVTAQDPLHERPLVLTVCSGEGGALTATAFRDGEPLWESDPSPAGEWTVRIDHGRVIAAGTEAGTGTTGEIIASERQAAWTAPGGAGVSQAAAFTSRLGIDGESMVVTNAAGQLLAYDTASGANLWTLPLSAPDAPVRGALVAGTVVALDPAVRNEPLDPRDGTRLRVIDPGSGDVLLEARTAEEIRAVHPVGGQRALVTVGEQSLLLGG